MKDNANKNIHLSSLALKGASGDNIRRCIQRCRDQSVAVISQTTAIPSPNCEKGTRSRFFCLEVEKPNNKKNEMQISFKKESIKLKTMNHFTKILSRTMLLALLFAVLICGCGGDNANGPLGGTNPPAPPPPSVQLTVALASASDYVVLAGSAITSTGATNITGDVGLSPGSSLGGFPPGIIVGVKHVNDLNATNAKLDLTTAYNSAAGRTLAPVSVAGNIGGRTLYPGLYKSTSSLEISSGDLTLNAQGNSNAVWIFQIASTLTTTPGRKVILSGGAKATNVYWQVGTSATLGTTTVFKGTIMADQSITMNTGASLEGRVLARIAGVTLNGNTIVKPAL